MTHDSVTYLRGEVNRLNNVIAERDYEIAELKRGGLISRAELVEAMDKERKQHALLDGGSEQEKYWDDGFKAARDFVKNWRKK